jgi:hypothetical protein
VLDELDRRIGGMSRLPDSFVPIAAGTMKSGG